MSGSRDEKVTGRRHVALSVSGGAYCYQMGIASYIQKHFKLDNILFSGASGNFALYGDVHAF